MSESSAIPYPSSLIISKGWICLILSVWCSTENYQRLLIKNKNVIKEQKVIYSVRLLYYRAQSPNTNHWGVWIAGSRIHAGICVPWVLFCRRRFLSPFCSKIPSESVYPNIKMAFEYTRSLTGVVHVFPDTTWGSENTPSWWWGYFLRDLWSSIRAASDTPHCVFSRPSVLEGQQVG